MRLYETYKDVKIFYNENNDMWYAENKELHVDIRAGKLSSLKSKIDKILKSKFEQFEAYYETTGDKFKKVNVTSITDYGDIWISYQSDYNRKERHKLYRGEKIFKINSKNETTILKINSLNKKLKEISNELDKLHESLENIDITQQQS